jgi:L-histidine N-alpha-methyltransferase
LNLLSRVNRELDADFDLSQFRHIARINHSERSVEMHLQSRCRQRISIPAAECTVEFAEGETIWTESSHKYSAEEVTQSARDTGFRCAAQWIDDEWLFAENLLIAE